MGRVRRSLEQRHPWMAGASPSGATMDGRGVAVAFACDLAFAFAVAFGMGAAVSRAVTGVWRWGRGTPQHCVGDGWLAVVPGQAPAGGKTVAFLTDGRSLLAWHSCVRSPQKTYWAPSMLAVQHRRGFPIGQQRQHLGALASTHPQCHFPNERTMGRFIDANPCGACEVARARRHCASTASAPPPHTA